MTTNKCEGSLCYFLLYDFLYTFSLYQAAYDRVLNAKKAAKLRHRELDSKRQKLKEELEARERQAEESAKQYRNFATKTDEEKLQVTGEFCPAAASWQAKWAYMMCKWSITRKNNYTNKEQKFKIQLCLKQEDTTMKHFRCSLFIFISVQGDYKWCLRLQTFIGKKVTGTQS